MTAAAGGTRVRASLFWRLYTLCWVALAGVAVSYFVLTATRPGFVDQITGAAVEARTEAAQADRRRMVAELKTLRETVKGLQVKLERVGEEVQANRVVETRDVPAIADKPPTPPTIEPEKQPEVEKPATVEQQQQPLVPAKKAVVVASRKLPPLPERVPVARAAPAVVTSQGGGVAAVVLNSARDGRIVTGSIPKRQDVIGTTGSTLVIPRVTNSQDTVNRVAAKSPAIQFGSPTVKPADVAPPASAVVVSAAPSVDGLRASWQQLSRQHPTLLGSLQPRYDVMGDKGPYRLLAGPLADRVEADRLCSALRVSGVTCGVGEFVGNAL